MDSLLAKILDSSNATVTGHVLNASNAAATSGSDLRYLWVVPAIGVFGGGLYLLNKWGDALLRSCGIKTAGH